MIMLKPLAAPLIVLCNKHWLQNTATTGEKHVVDGDASHRVCPCLSAHFSQGGMSLWHPNMPLFGGTIYPPTRYVLAELLGKMTNWLFSESCSNVAYLFMLNMVLMLMTPIVHLSNNIFSNVLWRLTPIFYVSLTV